MIHLNSYHLFKFHPIIIPLFQFPNFSIPCSLKLLPNPCTTTTHPIPDERISGDGQQGPESSNGGGVVRRSGSLILLLLFFLGKSKLGWGSFFFFWLYIFGGFIFCLRRSGDFWLEGWEEEDGDGASKVEGMKVICRVLLWIYYWIWISTCVFLYDIWPFHSEEEVVILHNHMNEIKETYLEYLRTSVRRALFGASYVPPPSAHDAAHTPQLQSGALPRNTTPTAQESSVLTRQRQGLELVGITNSRYPCL